MGLPLCLKNFAGKIFQTKKKRNLFFTTLLRKEQAAEAAVSGSSARKAPEGKAWNKADNFCLIVCKHDEARGRLDVRKGFPFLPKKMKFAEFFFRQGEGLEQGRQFLPHCAQAR